MRFEFVNSNMSIYAIKPLKIIVEMKPVPHLILIETKSNLISELKHITGEMCRNLSVQIAYLFQRIIHLNTKDSIIYRPLLQMHFDSRTNLSV